MQDLSSQLGNCPMLLRLSAKAWGGKSGHPAAVLRTSKLKVHQVHQVYKVEYRFAIRSTLRTLQTCNF